MKCKTAILWFRNDLRLHDNEPLCRALESAEKIIPVYCIDPRQFSTTMFGFPKTGAFRATFLLESLADLRMQLQSKGSELVIRMGKPEEIIPQLAEEQGVDCVYAHKEVTDEEVRVESAMEQQLFKRGISLDLYWGASLYHIEDLPVPVRALPEVFTQFRKLVEKESSIRDQFPTPETILSPSLPDYGTIPLLTDLGLDKMLPDSRSVLAFKGGETHALERLDHYFWKTDRLSTYKETRNGLLGADYSSKFSPWMALGCLSPRKIYREVKQYEQQRVKNRSTYWMIFELIWRDYFRFIAKKHGNTLFQSGGIKGITNRGQVNQKRFRQWSEGETGVSFIDANMRELNATGFMSNRGRQNVASYLVRDLGLDWRMGAAYFESLLIDYDVCSNWANWNYAAGVGNDPRENRYFNPETQAKRYDPEGEYVRTWMPELAQV